jgi:hypothetical protein
LVIWIFPIAHCLLPNALFLSKPVAGSINFSLLKKYFFLSLRGAIATKQSKKMRDNREKKVTVSLYFYDGIGDVCDPTPGCGGCGQPACEQQC